MQTFPARGKRRPVFILLRWVNALVHRPREVQDLHQVFTDGLTLCSVLQRLLPGTQLVRFRRAVTRGAALSNIEQALAQIWQLSPQASAMPSAEQILDGAPRELMLRFLSELYTMFVAAPARARLPVALKWLQGMLAPYAMALSAHTLAPPHAALGIELRSGTALACALHALLLPGRAPGLDGGVFGAVRTEKQRATNIRVVFAILARERLAPCSAEELLRVGQLAVELSGSSAAPNGPLLEAELIAITLSAMCQRFMAAPLPRRTCPPYLAFRDRTPRGAIAPPEFSCSTAPGGVSTPFAVSVAGSTDDEPAPAGSWEGEQPCDGEQLCDGHQLGGDLADAERMGADAVGEDVATVSSGDSRASRGYLPRAAVGSSLSGVTDAASQDGASCVPAGLSSISPREDVKAALLAEVDTFLRGGPQSALA